FSLVYACVLLLPLSSVAAVADPSSLLEVRVSSQGGSAAIGAQRVPLVTLTMSASCTADVTLSSVQLQHRGLGRAVDIERVYAIEGVRRITGSRSVSDDRGVMLH